MKKILKCDCLGPCDSQRDFEEESGNYKLKGNSCFFCGADLTEFLEAGDIDIIESTHLDKYGVAFNPKDLLN